MALDKDRADLRQTGGDLMMGVIHIETECTGKLAQWDTGKPAQERFFPGMDRRLLEIRYLQAYQNNYAAGVHRFFERAKNVYGLDSDLSDYEIFNPNHIYDLRKIDSRIARVLNELGGGFKATGPGITGPDLPPPTVQP